MSHTPLSLPLLGTYPKAIPAGLKALTESCFTAAGSANPLASPDPILPRDTQLGSTASDPAVGGAAPHHLPKPAEQGLKPRALSQPQLPRPLSRTQLRRAQDPLFGVICSPPSWFLLPNLPPSSRRQRTRTAGKLLSSCGGESSPPSNAPSNR